MIAFKQNSIDKLNKLSSSMRYRFKLYRRIIRKELKSINCTNLDFDISHATLASYFTFNGIGWVMLIDIDETKSYHYKNSNSDEAYVSEVDDIVNGAFFYLYNIKKDLGKKMLLGFIENKAS